MLDERKSVDERIRELHSRGLTPVQIARVLHVRWMKVRDAQVRLGLERNVESDQVQPENIVKASNGVSLPRLRCLEDA